MKEGFLSSNNHPGCQEEKRLPGIFAGKLQKMPFKFPCMSLSPLQSIPIWVFKNWRFPESVVTM